MSKFMKRQSDVDRVVELVRAAESQLGYRCSDGERRDLIADNYEWPLDYIRHVYADAKARCNEA